MEATKRCPYCAEEILAAAIRCKHCASAFAEPIPARDPNVGSDLIVMASPPTDPALSQANLGWALLGLPIVGASLQWVLVGNLSMLQSPLVVKQLITVGVVVGTAILAGIEANKLRMTFDRKEGTYNPIQWIATILLFWIIGYPVYLFKRRRFGRANLLLPGLIVAVVFLVSSGIASMTIKEMTTALPSVEDAQTSREAVSSKTEPEVAAAPQKVVEDETPYSWPHRAAADAQIAVYCAQIADRSNTEPICEARELAAWVRLDRRRDFEDSDLKEKCADISMAYSFEVEETCIEHKAYSVAPTDPQSNTRQAEVRSQQLNPREFIGHGSRAGDELTVLWKHDLDTDHAVIRAHLTRENAKHHCEEYDLKSDVECVDAYMKDGDSPEEIVANCDKGTFTTWGGVPYALIGRNPSRGSPDDLPPAYLVKDLADGSMLNGSSASGYSTAIGMWNALCPNKAVTDY